jgi:hypothetical protein
MVSGKSQDHELSSKCMNIRGKEVDCIQSANDEYVSILCMANVADWVAHGLFLIQVEAVRDRAGKFR